MELTQSGAKIEGVSDYKTNDGMLSTGMLSVNGYTKDNVGYIRFRDQREIQLGMVVSFIRMVVRFILNRLQDHLHFRFILPL